MGRHSKTETKGYAKKTLLGLTLLLGCPDAAQALSLGKIRVLSLLGQPFHAEVPILLRPGEVVKGANVTIGNADEYRILDLRRAIVVGTLRAESKRDKKKGTRIVVQGTIPIQTPFFDLLLKTTVGMGAHYRNFPVFLEVPEAEIQPAPPLQSPSQPPSPEELPRFTHPLPAQEVGSKPAISWNPSGQRRGSPKRATSGPLKRYGPVRGGETLARIARTIQPGSGRTPAQIMVALWKKNRRHFGHDNMNALPVGVILDLPDFNEMGQTDPENAREILDKQWQQWLAIQSGGASTQPIRKQPPPAPVPVSPQRSRAHEKPLPEGQTPISPLWTPEGNAPAKTKPPVPPKSAVPVVSVASEDTVVNKPSKVTPLRAPPINDAENKPVSIPPKPSSAEKKPKKEDFDLRLTVREDGQSKKAEKEPVSGSQPRKETKQSQEEMQPSLKISQWDARLDELSHQLRQLSEKLEKSESRGLR